MMVPLFGAHNIFYSVSPWILDHEVNFYFEKITGTMCASKVNKYFILYFFMFRPWKKHSICFKGFVIATLDCFTNKEVQSEIERIWKNWKSSREIDCNVCKQQEPQRKNLNDVKNMNQTNDSNKTELGEYINV